MLRGDIGALEVLRGRSLVDGLAATAAVVDEGGPNIQNGDDQDEDDVADDVAWGGCESEASGMEKGGGLG